MELLGLPVEILALIFTFLTDRLGLVRCVCSKWARLGRRIQIDISCETTNMASYAVLSGVDVWSVAFRLNKIEILHHLCRTKRKTVAVKIIEETAQRGYTGLYRWLGKFAKANTITRAYRTCHAVDNYSTGCSKHLLHNYKRPGEYVGYSRIADKSFMVSLASLLDFTDSKSYVYLNYLHWLQDWNNVLLTNKSVYYTQYMYLSILLAKEVDIVPLGYGLPHTITSFSALDILKWALEQGGETHHHHTFYNASQHRQLVFIEWLSGKGQPRNKHIPLYTTRNGHQEQINWLQKTTIRCVPGVRKLAINGGRKAIQGWLQKRGKRCKTITINSDTETLLWLRGSTPLVRRTTRINKHGYPVEHRPRVYSGREALRWIYEKSARGYGDDAEHFNTDHDRLDIVQWIHNLSPGGRCRWCVALVQEGNKYHLVVCRWYSVDPCNCATTVHTVRCSSRHTWNVKPRA